MSSYNLFLSVIAAGLSLSASAALADLPPPRLITTDGGHLARVKQAIQHGDSRFDKAMADLRREADEVLGEGPFTVVNKQVLPPSGDRHDYMSLSPFWWPNPDTPDGLPYVRRDGQFNPERENYDLPGLDSMSSNSATLALAYYLTDHEPYAEKAAELLRVWFIDPATRMNPNVKYAQFRPGYDEIRPAGLIETTRLRRVVDAAGMLEGSPAWTSQDHRALQEWFAEFLEYCLTSEQGRREAEAENNHGTWYDVQVATWALFIGDDEKARQIIAEAGPRRIRTQIEPDGRQPHELERTLSLHYSRYNLAALTELAALGQKVGVDLWNYQTEDGRSIRTALDFLLPHASGEQEWPYQQIRPAALNMFYPILRHASLAYGDEKYEQAIAKLPDTDPESSRVTLLQPPPDFLESNR
jgi:hypothetical protein